MASGASSGWLYVAMSAGDPAARRPDDRLIGVRDDDGIAPPQPHARLPVPGDLHPLILTDTAGLRRLPRGCDRRSRVRRRRLQASRTRAGRRVPRRRRAQSDRTRRSSESRDKKRPGAPAQSVPPVGGREDGTSKVRPSPRLCRVVQTQGAIRLRNPNGPIVRGTAAGDARVGSPPDALDPRVPPRPARSPSARSWRSPAAGRITPSAAPSAAAPSPAATPTPTPPARGRDLRRDPRRGRSHPRPRADQGVEPVALDETQLRANLTAEFDRENTARSWSSPRIS